MVELMYIPLSMAKLWHLICTFAVLVLDIQFNVVLISLTILHT